MQEPGVPKVVSMLLNGGSRKVGHIPQKISCSSLANVTTKVEPSTSAISQPETHRRSNLHNCSAKIPQMARVRFRKWTQVSWPRSSERETELHYWCYNAIRNGYGMVQVITVEREYGSQGAEFAHHLAQNLNWKFIENSLITEVAHRAGVSAVLAEQYDEHIDPWFHRLEKAVYLNSIDRMGATSNADAFDSARMVEFVHQYLLEVASQGNCVIVGRGAACVLANSAGAFHTFVYASMARKIRWFQEHFSEHAKNAEHEIIATDKRRAEYIRRFHHHDWSDRQLYSLMLNSCMGFDAMVKATVEAAGLRVGGTVVH